jgi:NADH-quinone oxidoreductase subunit J
VLFEQILFFLAAAGALGGALGVVLLRNPFYSVLALVGHLIALAVLFLLLHSEFLAAAQIVVYAGAVMVLYVFVTAYIGGGEEDVQGGGVPGFFGPLVALVLLVEITIAIVASSLGALDSRGAELGAGFGTPGQFGELLLTRFLVAFEAASFLLLVAAVGAVVLARRRRGLEDEPHDLPSVLAIGAGGSEPGEAPGNPPPGRIPAGTAEGRGDPVPRRGA